MDSPGHRKNIMGDFTEIGVARVSARTASRTGAADFGTPMPKLDPDHAASDLIKRLNEGAGPKLERSPVRADEKLAKAAQDQAAKLAKARARAGGTASFDGIDQKLYSRSP